MKKATPNGREIILMRHGQTKLNDANLIHGWTGDPLDENGMEHAYELGETLKEQRIELDGIYSSDLLRAAQTSLIVSQETGIPILGAVLDLRPWDIGKLSRTDRDKAYKKLDEYALESPDEDIDGGESFNTFKSRLLLGIVGILNSNRGLKLGFMTHSLCDRMVRAWIANDCSPDLEIDMDVYFEDSEDPATAQKLVIDCPLVLS